VRLTKLAELAVGDQESSKSAEALKSLVAMALGCVLADGRVRRTDRVGVKVLRLPDEVLQEVALVLGQQQVLGLLHNLTNIGNEALALGRELVGWA